MEHLSDSELMALYASLPNQIAALDNQQMAIKISLNSLE